MKRAGAKGSIARAALFLFALFLCGAALFLLGNGREDPLPAVPVLENSQHTQPRLLAAHHGQVLLACSGRTGGTLLRLESGSGLVLGSVETEGSIGWAGLMGDRLWIREDAPGKADLVCYDPADLSEVERIELELDPDELLLFATDGRGSCAWVQAESMSLLRRSGEEPLPLDGAVSLLHFLEDGALLAATPDTLYQFGEPSLELACPSPMIGATENAVLLSRDGVFSRLEDASLVPFLRWETEIFDPLSFCPDGENGLILAETGGRVRRVSPEGRVIGECLLEATALAVCPTGAVTLAEGSVRYTPFAFRTPEESSAGSSPSPSPAETASPVPRETPVPQAGEAPLAEAPTEAPVSMEGDYLILETGTTASQLRDLLWPDTLDLRGADGRAVSTGSLATGMTANQWTVVLEGDCNGTGTVNRSDLLQAMVLCFSDGLGPYARAADLNHDGMVSTADLLLLREKIRNT